MRFNTLTAVCALYAPETGAQGVPSPMVEGEQPADKGIPDVKAFQESQKAIDAAKDIMPRAGEPASNREGLGGNNPPIETSYVPEAKTRDQLLAEFKTVGEIILGHEAAGDTTINSAMARVVADCLFLNMPNLGHDREKLGIKVEPSNVVFVRDQNLYDNLRKEMLQTMTGTGESKWWGSKDVMETSTFRNYIGKACRKGVLLAFGIAAIGYIPTSVRGPALYKATGIPSLDTLPDGVDKSQFVRAIMVPQNVVWPTIYDVQILRDKTIKRNESTARPNTNSDLVYLSDVLADALYSLHFENAGVNGMEWDEYGHLVGIKKAPPTNRAPGGEVNQQGGAANGNAAPTGEAAKPGENIVMTSQRLKDHFSKLTDVAAGDSAAKGALMGIWNAIANDATTVSDEILRMVACMARDCFLRVTDEYKDDKAPHNLLRAYANLGELLAFHCFYDGKDSNVVLYRPDDNQKKPFRIKVGETKHELLADFSNGDAGTKGEQAPATEAKEPVSEPVKA